MRSLEVAAAAKEAEQAAAAAAVAAREAAAAVREQANPHGLLVESLRERQRDAGARRSELATRLTVATAEQGTMAALAEHFGKRGVQNLLYQLAIGQLQVSAGVATPRVPNHPALHRVRARARACARAVACACAAA